MTALFFPNAGERPETRHTREAWARDVCRSCAVILTCRTWARAHREYGFWGGESEEERAAAGFRVEMPVGRVALYPRGEGKPVQPRASRGPGNGESGAIASSPSADPGIWAGASAAAGAHWR